MSKILIITNKTDIHTDLVLRELNKRGEEVVRLHPDEFPTGIAMTYDGEEIDLAIQGSKRHVRTSDVSAVWYRRPQHPRIDPSITDPASRNFAAAESEHFVENLYGLLEHAFWVNPYAAGRRARNKLVQMRVGKKHGLVFPRTIVTNDLVAAKRFIETSRSGTVYKSVRVGLLHEPDGSSRLIFTTKLDPEDMERINEIRYAPCTFQEYVEKRLEIRATVVGTRVFSCAIYSQEYTQTMTDWRHGGARFEPWNLPETLNRRLIKTVTELGLVFGAFDIILTPNNEYIMEGLAGLPISHAIANLLTE